MAAAGRGNSISVSSSSSSPCNMFDFESDILPKLSLLPDQVQHCAQALKDVPKEIIIIREFERLDAAKAINEQERERKCSVALNVHNEKKNRYPDVLPYDTTRVILNYSSSDTPAAGEYINANHVEAPSPQNATRFIATQGPLQHTCEAFWEMIFQYRCPAIVMLTRLVDDCQTEKCWDYFPEGSTDHRTFGDMRIVTKLIKSTKSSLILRHLEVTQVKSEQPPLSVLHIQYPEWPDHGVPKNTLAVREILRRTFHFTPSLGLGPVVVHCSAGIGRTGTYCTIHHSIQRIVAGDTSALNLEETVDHFRSQRERMVQTQDQYLFCYKAILDELKALIRR